LDRSNVAIVGCGPAGMMIAHACWGYGIPFTIYAPEARQSQLGGAQYLHREIPNLTAADESFQVTYKRRGTEEGYESKIYGKLPAAIRTSWSRFPDVVRAWPLAATYRRAWALYADRIELRGVTLEDVLSWSDERVVFNTAPLPSLMPLGQYFSEQVWIVEGASASGYNQILYSGDLEDDWYRCSNIQGVKSFEFPGDHKSEVVAQVGRKITKPLSTDVDIPGVFLAGRYGRWEKGVLVDDAYFQACEVLAARY